MDGKRPRGPVGKSCLTCKRRHKKCDQSRPKCNRCIKGGYECSYEHNERAAAYRTKPPRQPWTTNDSPQSEDSVSPLCTGCELPAEFSSMVADNLLGPHGDFEGSGPPNHEPTETVSSTESISPQTQGQQFDSSLQISTTKPQPFSLSLDSTFPSDIRIPPSVVLLSPDSWRLINYIMIQYDKMLKFAYFKPIQQQLAQYRSAMILRLQSSSITRRTKLISFKICEAILSGEDWRYHTVFKGWVELLEQELCALMGKNTASQASGSELSEALEVSYVKSMLLKGHDTYQYLRHMAPTFLHAVFSDASLWPDGYEFTALPLARIVSSPRCELGNYVFMDTIYAMAYGLPQLINYNTFVPSDQAEIHGYAWSHGCPIRLQMALADINACRDKLPLARSWREIEQALLTWEPQPMAQNDEWESWVTVAWIAVQESWRHTLLVYLYMAAGDISSDDPRVQVSVRQILQVLTTMKEPERPVANVQMFAQYFIAGVCARTEKQRRVIRDKLADSPESRAWTISGACFVPVLEHLWRGAAFGGHPIKWSDYVRSREAMLPVSQ